MVNSTPREIGSAELIGWYRAQTPTTLRGAWAEASAELSLRELPLPSEWAEVATDVGGGGTLWSAAWAVEHRRVDGCADSLAHARIVGIASRNARIVNSMIFPARPAAMPVFVAEILEFGQPPTPRLAFVDLQGPGLAETARRRLCQQTESLLAELAERLPPAAVDGSLVWAVEAAIHRAERAERAAQTESSPAPPPLGQPILFSRPSSASAREPIQSAYQRVLAVWAELAGRAAAELRSEPASEADSPAAEELAEYKRQHRRHAPVEPFLARLFGADWAKRFISEFLYS